MSSNSRRTLFDSSTPSSSNGLRPSSFFSTGSSGRQSTKTNRSSNSQSLADSSREDVVVASKELDALYNGYQTLAKKVKKQSTILARIEENQKQTLELLSQLKSQLDQKQSCDDQEVDDKLATELSVSKKVIEMYTSIHTYVCFFSYADYVPLTRLYNHLQRNSKKRAK